MRALNVLAVLAVLAAFAVGPACVGAVDSDAVGGDDGDAAPGVFPSCNFDDDCAPAGPTCCECPTFAVHTRDPIRLACSKVECPPSECTANVTAVCNADHFCELACRPLACEAAQSCQYGYAPDPSGCLSCECAVPPAGGCITDTDCARTRADCCGCQRGGFDTAVLAADRAGFDASLMCSGQPFCPGVDTCTADVPTCVAGRCALVSPMLPAGACGRPDLPACPAGEVCIVNASDQANMHGVGVCGRAP